MWVSGRGSEMKIEELLVDGMWDGKNLELHTCYWHGCTKCFPNRRDEPLKDNTSDTHNTDFHFTNAKTVKLSCDHEVIEMWE